MCGAVVFKHKQNPSRGRILILNKRGILTKQIFDSFLLQNPVNHNV